MNINSTTKLFLVLNKLQDGDKDIFRKNIEPLNYFDLTPNTVLICSDLDGDAIVEIATKGIKENNLGKITVILDHSVIYGKGKIVDDSRETVFDK